MGVTDWSGCGTAAMDVVGDWSGGGTAPVDVGRDCFGAVTDGSSVDSRTSVGSDALFAESAIVVKDPDGNQ